MITLPRLTALFASIAALTSIVSATALTYRFAPNEKACFFAQASEKGQKMSFYFAVCQLSRRYPPTPHWTCRPSLHHLAILPIAYPSYDGQHLHLPLARTDPNPQTGPIRRLLRHRL